MSGLSAPTLREELPVPQGGGSKKGDPQAFAQMLPGAGGPGGGCCTLPELPPLGYLQNGGQHVPEKEGEEPR